MQTLNNTIAISDTELTTELVTEEFNALVKQEALELAAIEEAEAEAEAEDCDTSTVDTDTLLVTLAEAVAPKKRGRKAKVRLEGEIKEKQTVRKHNSLKSADNARLYLLAQAKDAMKEAENKEYPRLVQDAWKQVAASYEDLAAADQPQIALLHHFVAAEEKATDSLLKGRKRFALYEAFGILEISDSRSGEISVTYYEPTALSAIWAAYTA